MSINILLNYIFLEWNLIMILETLIGYWLNNYKYIPEGCRDFYADNYVLITYSSH